MLLAEEFLLLGIDPVKGRAPLGRSSAVEPGLAAALLAELALRGRVAVDGTSVAILDDSPTGDELLDDALAQLASDAGKGRALKAHLKRLDRGLGNLTDRVIGRLVAAGVLADQRRRVLGVPIHRHPVASIETYDELRHHVRAELRRPAGEVEPRAIALVALLTAGKLLNGVFESAAERKAARTQAQAAIAANPAAQALRKIVQEIESTAAVAAVVAASGS